MEESRKGAQEEKGPPGKSGFSPSQCAVVGFVKFSLTLLPVFPFQSSSGHDGSTVFPLDFPVGLSSFLKLK